jgi:hypothetical protein
MNACSFSADGEVITMQIVFGWVHRAVDALAGAAALFARRPVFVEDGTPRVVVLHGVFDGHGDGQGEFLQWVGAGLITWA